MAKSSKQIREEKLAKTAEDRDQVLLKVYAVSKNELWYTILSINQYENKNKYTLDEMEDFLNSMKNDTDWEFKGV